MSHSYEVTEIELLDGSMAGIVNDDSQLLSDAPSNSTSLATLLKNVRMSYAEAGKDASEAEFLLYESRKSDEKDKAQTTVAETVKETATKLQQKFGVEVEVIDNPDNVPNATARKAIAAGQTTWAKIKAAFRKFFRNVFGINVTNADIKYMLWKSSERLRSENSNKAKQLSDRITERRLRDEAVRMSREETDYQREIREITERRQSQRHIPESTQRQRHQPHTETVGTRTHQSF